MCSLIIRKKITHEKDIFRRRSNKESKLILPESTFEKKADGEVSPKNR